MQQFYWQIRIIEPAKYNVQIRFVCSIRGKDRFAIESVFVPVTVGFSMRDLVSRRNWAMKLMSLCKLLKSPERLLKRIDIPLKLKRI
jgi:hypothetical protein